MRWSGLSVAVIICGLASTISGSEAAPVSPAMPIQSAQEASIVEPAHSRRYRHCHRRVVRRCRGYRNLNCRVTVRRYCHRR